MDLEEENRSYNCSERDFVNSILELAVVFGPPCVASYKTAVKFQLDVSLVNIIFDYVSFRVSFGLCVSSCLCRAIELTRAENGRCRLEEAYRDSD